MATNGIKLSQNHKGFVDRFNTTCQHDDRVVAAILCGSYANGTADRYSDLDLYIIIVGFYKELAIVLTQAHNIPYPQKLEHVMVQRLEDLEKAIS